MSSLTITVDDVTLKKARIRALTEGISVNEVLRKFLESYAGVGAERAAANGQSYRVLAPDRIEAFRRQAMAREELHERE